MASRLTEAKNHCLKMTTKPTGSCPPQTVMQEREDENQDYVTETDTSLTHTAPSITLEPRRALAGVVCTCSRVAPCCCVAGVAPIIARIHCNRGRVHYAQEREKGRVTVTEKCGRKEGDGSLCYVMNSKLRWTTCLSMLISTASSYLLCRAGSGFQ